MQLDKSPDAFRTISEVADDLDLPQHVLRFWETRFPQIKPMKRVSQKRRTCWGRSRSSATSLMVRKASGLLSNCISPLLHRHCTRTPRLAAISTIYTGNFKQLDRLTRLFHDFRGQVAGFCGFCFALR